MADLVITAAAVVAGANARVETHPAGVQINAGQTVYQDPATKKWLLGDSNAAALPAHVAKGLALNTAGPNQPLAAQTGGDLTVNAVLTPGLAYYQSDTPGGICPVGDVGTGEYVCLLGLAKSTTVLALDIQASGTAN